MRACRRLLLVAILLALPLAAEAAQDEGSVGIRLVDAPTERADDPRAQVYVVDHLQPGDVIERRLEVRNTTAETLTIDLYAAAAAIDDGAWTPLDGRAENLLTRWTMITPAEVVVAPDGSEQAVLRVDVPADAPGGEHYAVAWAQLPSATDQGVTVVNRVGVRMYVSVGGSAEPATDFDITDVAAVTAADGSRSLVADVANIGGRAVDVGGELRLAEGPGSTTAGPYQAPSFVTIAAGSDGRLVIPVPTEIPAGPWAATVDLRSGSTARSATLNVTWPDPGDAPLDVQITDSDRDGGGTDVGAAAATALAALGALGVAVALGLFVRARRPG